MPRPRGDPPDWVFLGAPEGRCGGWNLSTGLSIEVGIVNCPGLVVDAKRRPQTRVQIDVDVAGCPISRRRPPPVPPQCGPGFRERGRAPPHVCQSLKDHRGRAVRQTLARGRRPSQTRDAAAGDLARDPCHRVDTPRARNTSSAAVGRREGVAKTPTALEALTVGQKIQFHGRGGRRATKLHHWKPETSSLLRHAPQPDCAPSGTAHMAMEPQRNPVGLAQFRQRGVI